MSRIDEALRRAETADEASSVETVNSRRSNGEEFVSPWKFGTAPAPSLSTVETKLSSGDLIGGERSEFWNELGLMSQERLSVSSAANWMLVEQFRRLAATLHQAQAVGNTKTIMVTSAAPGDGKTLTAINLALILSESYRRRVLLIDADLRRPSIRDVSHLKDVCGLSEGLKASSDRKLSVFQITKTLTLLPAGRPDPDPMSGLTSERMRQILEEATSRFDWVILDSPPVGTLADASLLAAMIDGALLVVRAGQTQSSFVQKAIDALGRERILGVVLNGVEKSDQPYYAADYSGYRTT